MAELTMTRADYAKHRGVSQAMVVKYEHQGLLVMDGDRIDVAKTDRMLDDNLDPIRGGDRSAGSDGGGADPTVRDLRIREQAAKVLKLEIENKAMLGQLVKRDDVDRETFARTVTASRDLLEVPELCAALVPDEFQEPVRTGVRQQLVRICEALADKAIRPTDVELLQWLEAEAKIVRARIAAASMGESHA